MHSIWNRSFAQKLLNFEVIQLVLSTPGISWIFEDFNGNNDGIMAGPLTFYVPWIAEFCCFNKDPAVRSWQSTETYGVVEWSLQSVLSNSLATSGTVCGTGWPRWPRFSTGHWQLAGSGQQRLRGFAASCTDSRARRISTEFGGSSGRLRMGCCLHRLFGGVESRPWGRVSCWRQGWRFWNFWVAFIGFH